MSRLEVALAVGTRPEAIKMAPVYKALERSQKLRPLLLLTGQHGEVVEQVCGAFGVRAAIDLRVMRSGQSLGDLTGRILKGVGDWLRETKPEALLVQGDTTTTFASGLAAFYERIPVGHVEAGLRTYDLSSPWPEEGNRRLVGALARWHFAATARARGNLLAERVPIESIHVTGNPVIDALQWIRDHGTGRERHPQERAGDCGVKGTMREYYFGAYPRRWLLVTLHRRESWGGGVRRVCRAINQLLERYPDLGIVFPVHPNPQLRQTVAESLSGHPRLSLIDPADYENFVWLMGQCHFVLSDSGGVQEEAPGLGKPVLVLREVTERPEGIEAGTCVLVGTEPTKIVEEASRLLDDPAEMKRRSQIANPYGDGRAAERIVEILESAL